MNKKLLSLLLVIPLSLTACSSLERNKVGKITALARDVQTVNKPVFKEKIEVTEPSEKEFNDGNFQDEETSKYIEKKQRKSFFWFLNTDTSKLSTTEKNWFYQPKNDGTPSGEPPEVIEQLKKYSGYYLGDTSKKIIYLTFDEGYENGYSSKILDALKSNDVKAAFFVTTDYINRNKDLVKRMVAEGHLVCNHSNTHPSMAQAALKDKDKFDQEFISCEKAFEEVTGTKMPKFFRPPMGKYSELSLHYTQNLGYKSIFWSFAYKDWIPTEQPSVDYAKKIIMKRTHNGGIFLLHAVSKTNADIMDSILKEWKSKGFEFKTLNDLP